MMVATKLLILMLLAAILRDVRAKLHTATSNSSTLLTQRHLTARAKLPGSDTATSNSSTLLTQRHLTANNRRAKLPGSDTATSNSSTLLTQRHLTANNREQAYVSAGSLVSFSSQLLAEEKADILDSLLYADLVASNVYDNTRSFGDWYRLYISTLQETGWEIKTLGFKSYSPNANTFTISSTVWGLLSPLCGQVQKEVLKNLLHIWQLLKDFNTAVLCFLTSSGTGAQKTNAANFQIMPAIRGSPGEVYLVFGGFYYQSQLPVMRYLEYNWQADMISLHQSTSVAKFKSSSYAPFRRQIQNSLGNRAIDLIHEINF